VNRSFEKAEDRRAILVAVEVSRAFQSGGREVRAVDRVSLSIGAGEFLAVTGRSGSGKTTLLNLLGGLDRPTEGAVYFEGCDLAGQGDRELTALRRASIGFVFQSFGLLPLLSAQENVEVVLHIAGMPSAQRRERAREVLEAVGLLARARHRPFELSGGEQQRLGLARALAPRPRVILADEPTGELDSTTGRAIGKLLADTVAKERVSLVVATHDLALAALAGRSVHLVDGRLADGPLVPMPPVVAAPGQPSTAPAEARATPPEDQMFRRPPRG
jgi:putative ABC transport system ATP-binding protein